MRSNFKNTPKPQVAPSASAAQARSQLQQALALHQRGDLSQAQTIYTNILKAQPRHADALHFLGVIAMQTGDPQHAVALIDKAIAIKPDYAQAHCNRGMALKALRQLDTAVASYDKALAIKPDYAEAYSNQGVALKELKQFDAAVASYDKAIAIRPDYAEAYYNRGNALQELKQFDAAVLSYDNAIAIRQDYADAYFNRGNALQELKQFNAAVASYAQAIAIKPDHAEVHFHRGNALEELKQLGAAITSYNQAIAIKPDHLAAYFNRGLALTDSNQPEAAVASYDQAIAIKPDYAEAYCSRGIALKVLKQLDAAVASYDQAIAIKPDYAEAHWNKSLTLLLAGDLARGWPLYEWRWKRDSFASAKRNFEQPLWLGQEPLAGKTILVHSEQGLGDTIQFCRYVQMVAELGAQVILEAEKPLAPLLKDLAGVSELIVKGNALPSFDCHCPLLSLPLAFKTDLGSIPCPTKYLNANVVKVSHWKKKLGEKTKHLVGLVWSGSAGHKNDHNRSIILSELVPHLPADCHYVSLQKEVRDIDQKALESPPQIMHFGAELNDFADTAALCQLMDVVITVDTSVAHLAAAMGKRTCVLLPYIPDWRWLLDRDDSPWYPSVKLFRQPTFGNWNAVFFRISAELSQVTIGGAQSGKTAID